MVIEYSIFSLGVLGGSMFSMSKQLQKTPRHDGVRGENRNDVWDDIGKMERKTGLEPATLTLAR